MIHETEITLPTTPQPTRATLAYLQACPNGTVPRGPLGYLHKVRSITGLVADAITSSLDAHAYYASLSANVRFYHKWAQGRSFDLVVRPPSRRNDSEPYAAAVRCACYGAADLSEFFVKPSSVQGGKASTVAELLSQLRLGVAYGETSTFKNVAVVDDVFSRGITATAVMQLLYGNGLPAEASVTICAPLWMQQP